MKKINEYTKEELDVVKNYLENDLKLCEKALETTKETLLECLCEGEIKQWIKDEYKQLKYHKDVLLRQIDELNYKLIPARVKEDE